MALDTSATLSDTVAQSNLSIITETINLLVYSGPIQILSSFGTLYTAPTLHFIAGLNYSAIGTFNPPGPLNAVSLASKGLSPDAIRSLLIYSGTILNYDTTAPSPSPTPVVPVVNTAPFRYAIYQMAVADAQLSDKLPIFEMFPFPLVNVCVEEQHQRRCRYPNNPLTREFRRWNYGYRDSIRPEF